MVKEKNKTSFLIIVTTGFYQLWFPCNKNSKKVSFQNGLHFSTKLM